MDQLLTPTTNSIKSITTIEENEEEKENDKVLVTIS